MSSESLKVTPQKNTWYNKPGSLGVHKCQFVRFLSVFLCQQERIKRRLWLELARWKKCYKFKSRNFYRKSWSKWNLPAVLLAKTNSLEYSDGMCSLSWIIGVVQVRKSPIVDFFFAHVSRAFQSNFSRKVLRRGWWCSITAYDAKFTK